MWIKTEIVKNVNARMVKLWAICFSIFFFRCSLCFLCYDATLIFYKSKKEQQQNSFLLVSELYCLGLQLFHTRLLVIILPNLEVRYLIIEHMCNNSSTAS